MKTSELRIIAGAAMLVAGCAGHDDQNAPSTTTGALAASPTAVESPALPPDPAQEVFVTLESQQDCPRMDRSACLGGYWLDEVNRQERRHVADLDFSALAHATLEQLSGGGPDLLLRGRFAADSGTENADSFTVLDAWRGLPGVEIPRSDRYFVVEANGEVLAAQLLNRDGERQIEMVSVAGFAPPFVDTAWLISRALQYGAIVAGRVDGRTLEAGQVYVRLPDVVGPCPLFRLFCGDQTATFDRSVNRCLIATGCEPGHHVCPLFVPVCGAGYKLAQWPSQPDGCPAFACDPAFLSQ